MTGSDGSFTSGAGRSSDREAKLFSSSMASWFDAGGDGNGNGNGDADGDGDDDGDTDVETDTDSDS